MLAEWQSCTVIPGACFVLTRYLLSICKAVVLSQTVNMVHVLYQTCCSIASAVPYVAILSSTARSTSACSPSPSSACHYDPKLALWLAAP